MQQVILLKKCSFVYFQYLNRFSCAPSNHTNHRKLCYRLLTDFFYHQQSYLITICKYNFLFPTLCYNPNNIYKLCKSHENNSETNYSNTIKTRKNSTCYRIISEATQKSIFDIAGMCLVLIRIKKKKEAKNKQRTWNKKVFIVAPTFVPKMS